jgi:hypothetical protein
VSSIVANAPETQRDTSEQRRKWIASALSKMPMK